MKKTKQNKQNWLVTSIMAAVSLTLIALSYFKVVPMSMTEVFGFITGATCVWLVAKDNIWNWPIGIANSIFYVIVFFNARLFADMSLQVIYIILGFMGWYWWLRGGENKTRLKVLKVSKKEVVTLLAIAVVSTFVMMQYLTKINDSAPFLDALTTVMSLVAQYMLTRKYIENWFVWLSVDVIYVGLYASRGLYLTSVLYALFFCMCLVGLKEWRKLVTKKHTEKNLVLAEKGQNV
ncbi:MAG: nicotinamide riboside transporter PnuC [bacterium]|nr:nicotinamide riboside transporter PnuC [bacterium]